jgi:hypothetical protein
MNTSRKLAFIQRLALQGVDKLAALILLAHANKSTDLLPLLEKALLEAQDDVNALALERAARSFNFN